jgi:hypothetical protein
MEISNMYAQLIPDVLNELIEHLAGTGVAVSLAAYVKDELDSPAQAVGIVTINGTPKTFETDVLGDVNDSEVITKSYSKLYKTILCYYMSKGFIAESL